MAHLQHTIEDLSAVIDELQPEHSAMDWASTAGTVIYVPVRVNQENEAPRAAPAHPEVQGPEGSTFPDASPSFRGTDNAFGLGRTANRPLFRGSGGAVPAKHIPAQQQNLGTNI